jgi:hypothetical protein
MSCADECINKYIKDVYNTGVDAVAIMPSTVAKKSDSDEVWKTNCEQLLAKTGSIPLGIYECARPYPRLLTPGKVIIRPLCVCKKVFCVLMIYR